MPVEVDFTESFPASDFGAWEEEYLSNVFPDLAFGSASKLDRELAQEFFGPLGPAMFPDELGHFDPFLEDLDGFDRPISAADRIGAAVCA